MPGIPGDIPGAGDMPGEPGIPGIPPNCAAAGQSGTTASTHANARARLSVMTMVPGRPIRPLDPAVPPINSPLNSAITRQKPGTGRGSPRSSDIGGRRTNHRVPAFRFLVSQLPSTTVRRPITAPMPRCDFRAPRLYLDAPIEEGASIALDAAQANYLGTVLRLKAGDGVLVFNGRDGEWRGTLATTGKRRLALAIGTRTRPQTAPLDLHYLFAPLKHARLDYMVQKAVEMGASRLQPVLTRHAHV